MASAATRQTSPKRTHFNEDPTDQTPTTTPTAKKQMAFELPQSFLRSHTALLHPETVTIIQKFHLQCIKLKSFVLTKTTLLKMMESDEDFFPQSCRLNFTHNPSNIITELQNETMITVNIFNLSLKLKS
eukprot:9360363-Ditylum_brightwellii.AAC.1